MNSERRPRRGSWTWAPLVVVSLLGCADFSRGSPSQQDGSATGASADGGGTGDGQAAALSFATDVYPLLSVCMTCHVPGGAASDTSLIFSGTATTDYPTVLQFVDTSAPAGSRILSKVSGNGHGGGTVYAVGSPEYDTLLAWIQQGAPP